MYTYYDIVILSVPIINVSYIIYRYAAGGIYNCQRPVSLAHRLPQIDELLLL